MFCNLIESIEVECLGGDYLPQHRVVTSQNVVIALKITGVRATLDESDRKASNNDNIYRCFGRSNSESDQIKRTFVNIYTKSAWDILKEYP